MNGLKREFKNRANVVLKDVYTAQEDVERYGISALPTALIFDSEGSETYRFVGPLEKELLRKELLRFF